LECQSWILTRRFEHPYNDDDDDDDGGGGGGLKYFRTSGKIKIL